MGKRSNFERKERDFYPTPYEAVVPLFPHLGTHRTQYHEPCIGEGDLAAHLSTQGHICNVWGDIKTGQNALDIIDAAADCFITNPPWDWKTLDPIITHLSHLAPTWLLLNADLMHNKRMGQHMKRCSKVVSVGRVSWMQNGKKGFENCAWFLFHRDPCETVFYGR